MASVKRIGELVKEARAAAGLTQEKLAQAAGEGLTAGDIGKCERGVADLTTAQLKAIAKTCGVTQTSLVNAPKNLSESAKKTSTAKTSTAKTAAAKASGAKTTAAKTTAAKASGAKTTAARKTTAKNTAAKTAAAKSTAAKASAKKTTGKPAVPASANVSMKVTSTEQKLIEAYRGASSDLKKVAMKVLKGEYGDTVTNLLNVVGGGSSSGSASDGISDAISNLLGGLLGGK